MTKTSENQLNSGTYERHMEDIKEYLRSKFPIESDSAICEAAGYISNRTICMVINLLHERNEEWKELIRSGRV